MLALQDYYCQPCLRAGERSITSIARRISGTDRMSGTSQPDALNITRCCLTSFA